MSQISETFQNNMAKVSLLSTNNWKICGRLSLSTVLTASSNSIVTVTSINLCCVLYNVLHQSYVYCFAVTFERT